MTVISPFRVTRIERQSDNSLSLFGSDDDIQERVDAEQLIVATGFRPDFSFLREIGLIVDPWLESSGTIGPLIDPNLHSCGTVRPHGAKELAHAEPGFNIAGMKATAAPPPSLATGHEQVRSIVAGISGDAEAAARVELELPETGVCLSRPASGKSVTSSWSALASNAARFLVTERRGDAVRMTETTAVREDVGWQSRRGRTTVIATLGFTQCLAWGSSYYLPAVLARPIATDTGWPLASVVTGLSLGLLLAGLASPAVGREIERRGGRPVLAAGSAVLALGLAALGLAHDQISYFAAWSIVGIGMAAGLYDPAFAALGRLYGAKARGLITSLTLIGGFASTAAWPLSALMVDRFGWRGACFGYAAMHLALGLPMHLVLLPREARRGSQVSPSAGPVEGARTEAAAGRQSSRRRLLVWLLGTNFTLQAIISAVISVHLLTILQGLGLAFASAVGLGTLVGPSQVGGRLLEVAFGRRFHPVWTAVAASVFVLLGVGMLIVANSAVLAAALILYGAGNGIKTIVKGTLPLALFGPSGYASLIGRLAMPWLVAQAAAPPIVAVMLAGSGAKLALALTAGIAFLNLLLSFVLLPASQGGRLA